DFGAQVGRYDRDIARPDPGQRPQAGWSLADQRAAPALTPCGLVAAWVSVARNHAVQWRCRGWVVGGGRASGWGPPGLAVADLHGPAHGAIDQRCPGPRRDQRGRSDFGDVAGVDRERRAAALRVRAK